MTHDISKIQLVSWLADRNRDLDWLAGQLQIPPEDLTRAIAQRDLTGPLAHRILLLMEIDTLRDQLP